MIKVLLTGGLGNQMFQYAFARTLSIKHNTSLVLNTSYLQSKLPISKLVTQMKYELDIFNINAKVEANFFSSKYLYPLSKTEYFFRKKLNEIKLNTIHETQFSFQKELFISSDNSFVIGNFQSEKYFEIINDLLRKEFTFKQALTGTNADWKNKILSSNSVSIHIRRGDYISLKQNQNKFNTTPISYYNTAIDLIKSKTNNPVFFIFSDDIDWAKENIKTNDETYFVANNNTPQTSYIDMQLMSVCKHNIITNSTFSWWAAWLNNNPNKIVIAPSQWFTYVSINSQDIIPQEWIKL